MVFFPSALFTGFTHLSVATTTAASAIGMVTASVVKDFFTQLFLNPGDHFMAVAAICVVAAAPCIGLAFLIKMLYKKYCPDATLFRS
jgi:hypothetical protein